MFGADGDADIVALLESAQSVVAFDLSFSAGVKFNSIFDAFWGATASTTLFFRINDLGIFAEASVKDVNVDLFAGAIVDGGNFLLSAGLRLAAPFEAEVTADGSFASGISFSSTITSALTFEPHGQLIAALPLTASAVGIPLKLTIKLEDSNIFDSEPLLTTVDFPVCSVITGVLEGLLSKLGSLTNISPKTMLGVVQTSNIDFGPLDELFPDITRFINGALEGQFY